MKKKFLKLFLILSLIFAVTIGCYAFSFRNMTLDLVHLSDTHISTTRGDTSYKALGSSSLLLKDAIEQTNKIFADYGIEAHFENLKNFKGNFFQVVKMVEDFIEELQEKALKKEN